MVRPPQISFQNPSGTSTGSATFTILLNGSTAGQGATAVEPVTPGLFARQRQWPCVAAAIAFRVKADGTQVTETLLRLNQTTKQI